MMPDSPPVSAEDVPQSVVEAALDAWFAKAEHDSKKGRMLDALPAALAEYERLGCRLVRVDEATALLAVERAARELDQHFDPNNEGGKADEWKLDGRRQASEVSTALLILHDCLNDVERARAALTAAQEEDQ